MLFVAAQEGQAKVRVCSEYGESGGELGQSGDYDEHGFELHFCRCSFFELLYRLIRLAMSGRLSTGRADRKNTLNGFTVDGLLVAPDSNKQVVER